MEQSKTSERNGALSNVVRLQLAIAFAAFLFIGTNDGAGGVVLPSLQQQYSLNKSTVSAMFFAGTCGYLLAAFSSGILVERLGRRLFLMLGAAALVTGTFTIATAPAWLAALAAFSSVGFGIAIVDAGLNTFVAELPENTSLLNYLHAFYGGGALIGPLLASGLLTAGWRWNTVYVVLALAALVLGLCFAFIFAGRAGDERVATAQLNGDTPEPDDNVIAATMKLAVVWVAALFLLLYVGVEVSIGSWTFSYLTEERGITTLQAGWLVSSYWTGLTIGRLVLGSVTRKLGNILMVQVCLGGLVVGLLLLWLVPHVAAAAAGLLLAGFCLGPIFPTMIAVISHLVPPRLLPTAIGFLTSLGAAGASLFPWIAGTIANQYGVWVIPPYAIGLTALVLGLWLAFRHFAGRTNNGRSLRGEGREAQPL